MDTKNLFYAICVAAFSLAVQSKVAYEGSQVWRLTPTTESELELIYKFIDLNSDSIDLWQDSSVLHRPVDLMVPADKLAVFRDQLQPHLSKFDVMIDDVHAMVLEQKRELESKRKSKSSVRALVDFDYTTYHSPDEIQAWMDMATDEFSEVTQFQVGVTYEGRKINALKISTDTNATKTTIYVDSLIHAREWITAASVMWTFKEILTNPELEYMKNDVDWYIVPMINVDGYSYTHSDDRLWRKTRSKGMNLQSGTTCQGVDANRNWDHMWSGDGASPYPCDQTYHGPMGFSESEVRHLSYFIEENKDHIKAAISIHSYGQYLLYPYNYALNVFPDNKEEHDTLGQDMKNAIEVLYGTEYTFGQGAETIYVCSGVTTDWTAGVAGIDINFTFELRDLGEFGFLLPPEQIIPTAEELLEAFKVLVAHVTTA